MFRWKKRDEGFEWQNYVRTTIKLRREARRDKAHRLGQKAADGARQAAVGARGAGVAARDVARDMARSGAGKFGAAVRSAAARASDWAVAALGLVGLGLGLLARFLGRLLAKPLGPLLDILGRPGVSGPLILAGAIALAAGVARVAFGRAGLDAEARIALTIAAACLGLGLGPGLWLGHRTLSKSLTAPFAHLAAIPSRAKAIIGAGLVVVGLIAGVSVWHPSALSLPRFESLPAMPFTGSTVKEGRARALSGDSLRIGDTKIRLSGIIAPEPEQRCQRSEKRTFPCGENARDAVARIVRGSTTKCETSAANAAGETSGRCWNDGEDIAAKLVKAGHVFAESGFIASTYASEDRAARAAKAGIWAVADPERPEAWRKRLWNEAKQQAPDGCPIKGRIRRGKRVYVLPWSSGYERVRIRKSRGERWFCSETEAVTAGWKEQESG